MSQPVDGSAKFVITRFTWLMCVSMFKSIGKNGKKSMKRNDDLLATAHGRRCWMPTIVALKSRTQSGVLMTSRARMNVDKISSSRSDKLGRALVLSSDPDEMLRVLMVFARTTEYTLSVVADANVNPTSNSSTMLHRRRCFISFDWNYQKLLVPPNLFRSQKYWALLVHADTRFYFTNWTKIYHNENQRKIRKITKHTFSKTLDLSTIYLFWGPKKKNQNYCCRMYTDIFVTLCVVSTPKIRIYFFSNQQQNRK